MCHANPTVAHVQSSTTTTENINANRANTPIGLYSSNEVEPTKSKNQHQHIKTKGSIPKAKLAHGDMIRDVTSGKSGAAASGNTETQ